MENRTEDARRIFDGAVRAVQADGLLADLDLNTIARRPLGAYNHLYVLGMGKASLAMASVLEAHVERSISGGCVAIPAGYEASLPDRFSLPLDIEVAVAGHPLPNEGSVVAARRVLEIASHGGKDDLVIVLISGGGSASCIDFVAGISLMDASRTFQLLLEAGVDIYAMNAVRKHLSRIGGGRLAAAAYPAEVVSLVISDVVGDDLSVIASGPTSPDPSTLDDALSILREFGIWEKMPPRVRDVFGDRTGNTHETPKGDAVLFESVANHIIGSNARALQAAADTASAMGYAAHVLEHDVVGEAREVGRELVDRVHSAAKEPKACYLAGGETTVTINGRGRGGRNQELALSAALALDGAGRHITFLSGGTDGIDGPTDVAGAVVTDRTVSIARAAGRDPEAYLADNDSYGFFEQQGGHIRTGPTHTNVMDVQIILTATT